MKKTNLVRKLTAVTLTVTMLFTMSTSVFASSDDVLSDFKKQYSQFAAEEQRRIDEITNSPNSKDWIGVIEENVPIDERVSLYPMCIDCSTIAVLVCAQEAILVDEGYHNDFLGITQTDCYAYYFESRGASMCPQCLNVIFQYGQHACREVHKKCSKGDYDICPMEIS